jgi:hypothetical protein
MKIHYRCGATIHDGGDSLPNKGHLIPDAQLFDLLERIEAHEEEIVTDVLGASPHAT